MECCNKKVVSLRGCRCKSTQSLKHTNDFLTKRRPVFVAGGEKKESKTPQRVKQGKSHRRNRLTTASADAGGPVSGIKGTKETLEWLQRTGAGFPGEASKPRSNRRGSLLAPERRCPATLRWNCKCLCLLLTAPRSTALLPRSCMRAHGKKKRKHNPKNLDLHIPV